MRCRRPAATRFFTCVRERPAWISWVRGIAPHWRAAIAATMASGLPSLGSIRPLSRQTAYRAPLPSKKRPRVPGAAARSALRWGLPGLDLLGELLELLGEARAEALELRCALAV